MGSIFIVCFKNDTTIAPEDYLTWLTDLLKDSKSEIVTTDIIDEQEFGNMIGSRMLETIGKDKHTKLH